MPIILAATGNEMSIKKITGNDKTRRFLSSLGFVIGETVTVISELGGNLILNVKGSRIALDKGMASRIIV
ncbi:ferrous iron transport protein A [Clostridium estertheticum]|uniref:FeoA family protein n=1 Tax=Clostridium estertheticum TaxID=238834 RepID=UPI001C0D66C1|nr:FeoA family protein [Clostridium estertheticum]MBU3214644.1 ferrous iron transport protein A [Clostridium estertheticum]MCB2307636.1 ferrous iron transport protein A [Clostridium estertheticum]MCB2346761.1 ferrous iron transport protein A [Clostridium estertheticum]MCB2351126.1 ferrous iron transport protein A [Clostridium estertheticum]WAG46660.1 ferrous iron transport protein A [Clostridium estertheticum]